MLLVRLSHPIEPCPLTAPIRWSSALVRPKVAAVGNEVAGYAGSERLRGAARSPVVVEHQRIARIAHPLLRHRQERLRRHCGGDTAAARRFDDADIDKRPARASSTLRIEGDA